MRGGKEHVSDSLNDLRLLRYPNGKRKNILGRKGGPPHFPDPGCLARKGIRHLGEGDLSPRRGRSVAVIEERRVHR